MVDANEVHVAGFSPHICNNLEKVLTFIYLFENSSDWWFEQVSNSESQVLLSSTQTELVTLHHLHHQL